MTTTYRATVTPSDDMRDPATRGYNKRTYESPELDRVNHWAEHVYMDYPDADIAITKVEEGPVT